MLELKDSEGFDFKRSADALRSEIKMLCSTIDTVKTQVSSRPATPGESRGEVMANIMLAFRHLEDAAMRIGKAIQATQGGESPLGGPSTPSSSDGYISGASNVGKRAA